MSGKSIKRLFQAVTSFVLAGSMAIPNGISVFAETADDQSVTSVSVPVTITTDSGEGPDAVTVRLNSDNELAYTQLTKENGYSGSFTVNKSDLMDDAGNAKTLTVGADAADGYSIEVTAQPEVTVTPVTELAAQISSEAQTVNEELVTDGYNLAVGVNESGAYILTDAELSEEAKATLLSNTAAATGITSVMGFITGLDLHEYATAYLGTYEYLTHYEVTVSEAKLKMEKLKAASFSLKNRNTDSTDNTAFLSDTYAVSKEYNLYYYGLIPGNTIENVEGSNTPDQYWFGLGVAKITGVDNPVDLGIGTKLSSYTINATSPIKALYPDLTFNSTTYKYAVTDEQKNQQGYYTLVPNRVIVAAGANAGNNKYNNTEVYNKLTYHYDHIVVLNETEYRTVTFNVMYPGETVYDTLSNFAQRVADGYSESSLRKPSVGNSSSDTLQETMTYNSVPYRFDGWYKDSACTIRADFRETITQNANYYAKYVEDKTTYTVNYYINGTQEKIVESETIDGYVGATVSSNAKTIKGYTLTDSNNSTQSLTLGRKGNVINFYYYQNVVLQANSKEETYDGTEKSVSGYVFETALGQDSLPTFDGLGSPTVSGTHAGTYRNDFAKGTVGKLDKTGRYIITEAKAGTLKINQATLTVTTESASKVYDGDPLTAGGAISGFVKNETAIFTVTGSQTEVGSSNNTYNINWNGSAEKSDYKVSESIGTLTVTQYADEIVVTTTGGEFTYDGEAHRAKVSVSSLPKGYTLEKAESNATATHVAEGKVNATCDTLIIRNAHGKDVTSNLNITKVDGSITITPATLTVTTESASKVYDGDPLTAGGAISGFVKNETAIFTVTGSQTEVGSSNNTYNINWNGSAEKSDYKVSESIGTLTVTQYADEIVVTTTGGEFTYDGEAHRAKVSVSSLPKGYTLEKAESNATATHVAEGKVNATCDTLIIRNAHGKDVTSNLNITKVDGSITITPATLTVTTENASKVYDGDPLTAGGAISGFVKNETAIFTVTGSQTEVGSSDNTYNIKWDGSAEKSDYTVSESIGTLTVTRQSISPDQQDPDAYKGVTVDDPQNHVYDGQVHKFVPQVKDALKNELVEDKDYTVSYDTENFTDVHTITVTVTGIGNYEGTVKKTYGITRRNVILESATASKVFDGNPLTDETVTVNGDGFVKGDAEYAAAGTITEVGTTENPIELTFADEKIAERILALFSTETYSLRDNYTIEMKFGTLTVTPKAIDPEDPDTDDEKRIVVEKPEDSVYDGEEHVNRPVIKDPETGEILEEGKDYELTYPDDVTNAGEKTVIVEGKGNYEGEFEVAYEITPRPITVKADDASKTEGRKDPEFTAQLSEELIEGNEIVYELNREEGEEAGEYAIHPTGAIKQGNYIVSYADGTLTINRAPETPVTNDKPRPQTPMTPNTSDSTNIVMYAGFAIAALIAILGVIILRKKEN